MLGIVGIAIGRGAFPPVDREVRFEAQHLAGLRPGLNEVIKLGVGSGKPQREYSNDRRARPVDPQGLSRLRMSAEHVVGVAKKTKAEERLKRVETGIRLQYFNGSRWFASKNETKREAIINQIRIQREGLLELR